MKIPPPYISLYNSGELEKRAQRLNARLANCDICPRACGVNRLEDERGFCNSGGHPIVASICAHNGEEPALSGQRGSGTIFLGNCNLRCVFCQNHQISQNPQAQLTNEIDCRQLAQKMIYLQDELGCHNINFVSPSHFVPQIVTAVLLAIPEGLKIPLVYNSNGHDALSTLKELAGIISIYLPDLKYADNTAAEKLSEAPEYVEPARKAIKEMFLQTGNLIVDEAGVAVTGLIVRHLILPEGLAGSSQSLKWLAEEVSPQVAVSLMAQYHPCHKAINIPALSRPITTAEYEEALTALRELKLGNGWLQDTAAEKIYLPDFEKDGSPFA